MNTKYTSGTKFLLAILVIRMVMQLLILGNQEKITPTGIGVALFFALIYLCSVIGIVQRQRWGAIIALIIGAIDIFSALALGGPSAIGAGVVDILILFLAYREYKLAGRQVTI